MKVTITPPINERQSEAVTEIQDRCRRFIEALDAAGVEARLQLIVTLEIEVSNPVFVDAGPVHVLGAKR